VAERRARYDRYGRPLPAPVPVQRQSMAETEANKAQRVRLLRLIDAKLDEQGPHLMRADVNAEVTLSFKVLGGTVQEHLKIAIVWQYPKTEE
jgi:hypothetical protein